jgi:hypothetical protein
MGIASLIKEMPGKSTSVTDSTHCINTEVLCSGSNDAESIDEEVPFWTGKLTHKKCTSPLLAVYICRPHYLINAAVSPTCRPARLNVIFHSRYIDKHKETSYVKTPELLTSRSMEKTTIFAPSLTRTHSGKFGFAIGNSAARTKQE